MFRKLTTKTVSGLTRIEAQYWKFIPKGVIPKVSGVVFEGLEVVGTFPGVNSLRGGFRWCALESEIWESIYFICPVATRVQYFNKEVQRSWTN